MMPLTPINRIPFRILKPTLHTLRATAYICISLKGQKDMLSAKTVAAQEYTDGVKSPTRLQLLTHIGIWYRLCEEWRGAFTSEKMGEHIANVLQECAWVGEMLALLPQEEV